MLAIWQYMFVQRNKPRRSPSRSRIVWYPNSYTKTKLYMMYSSATTDAFLPVHHNALSPWVRPVPPLPDQRLLCPTYPIQCRFKAPCPRKCKFVVADYFPSRRLIEHAVTGPSLAGRKREAMQTMSPGPLLARQASIAMQCHA